MPGLQNYLQENFWRELKKGNAQVKEGTVELVNPFREIFYPPILEPTIKALGPSYAVAVGMALRGFE